MAILIEGLSEEVGECVRSLSGAKDIVGTELVQSLWSGYGQILRCQLVGGSVASVVVKEVRWPDKKEHPRGWNSSLGHARKVRSYAVESNWYENYAHRCASTCPVPKLIGGMDRDEGVVLVLEDLDTSGYPRRSQQASDSEIRACIQWLANFHANSMAVAPDGLWPVGSYWHLATRSEEWAQIPQGALRDGAAEVDRKLSECEFQTLVHGDAKLANFCFSPDGQLCAAVDFQYVGGGCGMKDLAYFISSCLDEEECQKREEELLALYFATLREALVRQPSGIDADALEQSWRGMYPLAWTDFYRFLKGWSPGHWKLHSYSEAMAERVLNAL